MGRLTILHLTAPGQVGGLESVVRGLAAGHAARGHRVAVFATVTERADGSPFIRSLGDAGIETHHLQLAGRSYHRQRAAIRRLVSSMRPAIIHSHGYRSDVVGLIAGRNGGRRVTTVHGFTGGDWKNRLYERVQLRALRHFDAVVAVSRPLVERLRSSGVDAQRVHLIPNGLPLGRPLLERDEARQALGVSPADFVIGWVGRLSHEKGMDVMLDALRRLDDLPLTVAVLGDGRERAALEAGANADGRGKRIRWLGLVPEARSLFGGFDLFALSSRTEGTPMTLLEAMQAGVPSVVTAVGGVPDVISPDQGWMVPPERPEELAAAIREAWSRPDERARRAQAARRRLDVEFAVEPWLDRYEALYRTLATSGSHR
jgi:glycosyltransferase involved in cell wall biosynthesis